MNAQHRADDPEAMTIDRKIPLWGIFSVIGAFVIQGAVVWNGQNLQAAELRHQSEQLHELTTQVKAMAAQLSAKDAVDVKQDLRIDELERRVLTMEQVKGLRQ
jgi:hypothetical protein